MKVLLIAPPFDDKSKSVVLPFAPPVLAYLAGLTHRIRPDVKVELIDANREALDVESMDADLVGISVLTPLAPWAYRLADRIRERKIKVILGGWHVTALPEEAKGHADAVVVGEAEGVWGEVLQDASKGTLRPYYQGEAPDLKALPRPETSLLNESYPFATFFTQRGCPHGCSFCSIRRFYGPKVRMRPIGEVVNELNLSPYRFFYDTDDNVWGTDVKRAIELFREMNVSCKRKWWFCNGDLSTVQQERGEELLKWASRANMTVVMVGWESSNPQTLAEFNANTKHGKSSRDAIKRIKSHGIDIIVHFILGGREDTPDDFKRVVELCDELGVAPHPVLLFPLPGTELYSKYQQYLYEDIDWDMFDGRHAVFKHDNPLMTGKFREERLFQLWSESFTWSRIMSRLSTLSIKGFPMSHISSFMYQSQMKKASKNFGR